MRGENKQTGEPVNGCEGWFEDIDKLLNEAIKNLGKIDFYWKTFNSEFTITERIIELIG